MRWEIAGTPKNLRVFAIFGFSRALRRLRRTSEGAGGDKTDGLGVRGQELGVEIRGRCREEVYSSPTNR
jgi:hypothetical protein